MPDRAEGWRDRLDDRVGAADRWWKYLVIAGYSLRERAGYTASEALYAMADRRRRNNSYQRLEVWGDKARKWVG